VKKRLAELILERGAKVVGRAAGAVLSDPRGQEALARAVGVAQRGRRVLAAVQEKALHAAGLAARPDYAELRKQVVRLKRKTRDLGVRLRANRAAAPGNGAVRGVERRPDDAG